jgi:hypothetical protein
MIMVGLGPNGGKFVKNGTRMVCIRINYRFRGFV